MRNLLILKGSSSSQLFRSIQNEINHYQKDDVRRLEIFPL